MALESTIQSDILEYLNSLKGCVAENVLGCASQKDRPDVNCCYKGQTWRIEVKSPDNGYMPTKGQILNLKQWSKSGAFCIVVWSLEDVIAAIQAWQEGYLEEVLDFTYVTWKSFKGWNITPTGKVIKHGHKGGNERVNKRRATEM
jgi:hypothetical protein